MAKKGPMRLELCRRFANDMLVVDFLAILIESSDDDDSEDDGYGSPDDASVQPMSRSMTTSLAPEQQDESTQTESSRPPSPSTIPSEMEPLLVSDAPRVKVELQVDDFHVFTLLATVPIPSPPLAGTSSQSKPSATSAAASSVRYQVDEKQLENDLKALDQYLATDNSRQMESIGYSECPTKTTYDIEQSCSRLDRLNREEYMLKRTLVRAVRDVFELFFPLRYEHPVTLKVRHLPLFRFSTRLIPSGIRK